MFPPPNISQLIARYLSIHLTAVNIRDASVKKVVCHWFFQDDYFTSWSNLQHQYSLIIVYPSLYYSRPCSDFRSRWIWVGQCCQPQLLWDVGWGNSESWSQHIIPENFLHVLWSCPCPTAVKFGTYKVPIYLSTIAAEITLYLQIGNKIKFSIIASNRMVLF